MRKPASQTIGCDVCIRRKMKLLLIFFLFCATFTIIFGIRLQCHRHENERKMGLRHVQWHYTVKPNFELCSGLASLRYTKLSSRKLLFVPNKKIYFSGKAKVPVSLDKRRNDSYRRTAVRFIIQKFVIVLNGFVASVELDSNVRFNYQKRDKCPAKSRLFRCLRHR